jgi:hypothetical protein
MRKRLLMFGLPVIAVLAVGIYTLMPSAGAVVTGKVADNALFDQTSGDTTVFCRTTNGGAFEVNMAFRAINGNAVLRVTFQDGSFVEYPIPQNTSFSLTEAAGTTAGVDKKIVVTSAGSPPGQLVGWMTASRSFDSTDTLVVCGTT